jgi:tetratricopeptide (TPR) repeat protein
VSFYALGGVCATAGDGVVLPTRQVSLDLQLSTERAEWVFAWVSFDGGWIWTPAELEAGTDGLCYIAPGPGRYDLYFVVEAGGAISDEFPSPGSRPHLSLTIDELPPVVQVRSAALRTAQDGRMQVEIDAIVSDENLGPEGVRLFTRDAADAAWVDAGPLVRARGNLWLAQPLERAAPRDLRVVVTDLAGNSRWDELRGVAPSTPAAPPAPAADQARPGEQTNRVQFAADAAEVVAPAARAAPESDGSAAHGQPQRGAESPAPDAKSHGSATLATAPDPAAVRKAAQLRGLAQRFRDEGRYELALARLDDALALTPRDSELLVERGAVLFQLQRVEEAQRAFAGALELHADLPAALEGLALVAATRGEYARACERLERLVTLEPGRAVAWLRLGDMRHRLGRVDEAIAAWRRAAAAAPRDAALQTSVRKRLAAAGS